MYVIKTFFTGIFAFFFFITFVYPQQKYVYPATEKYRFSHLTTENGLPSNWCWEVIKDSHGFIWITTRAGLCRYDGYSVKVYQHDPSDSTSISSNRITKKDCILEDKEGNIWVGTYDGLNRLNPLTDQFIRFEHNPSDKESISHNRINCVIEDKTGAIWVGVGPDGGLNRYYPEKNAFRVFKPQVNHPDPGIPVVISLFEDNKGRFWIGTSRGLFLFDREMEQFSPIHVAKDYPEIKDPPYCRTIHEDTDGTIVIGTSQGFILYDEDIQLVRPYPSLFHASLNRPNQDFLPGNFDNQFTHWVISIVGIYGFNKNSSYLARIRPDPIDPLSISGNSLKSVFRDETGMLWIPGEFGVNIMDPIRQHIKQYPGKVEYGTEPTCFLEDSQGHLWKATRELEEYDTRMNLIKSYSSIIKDPGRIKISGSVFSMFEDQNGNIWVGNDNNGLFLLKKNADALVPCTFSKSGISFIWDIFEDSSGTLWVGTNSGLFYKKKGDTPSTHFYNEPDWDFLNISTILDITQDRHGNLWLATSGKGLFCQPSDSSGTNYFYQFFNDPLDEYSISNNWVWSIHEDAFGNLWVATENGLNKRIGNENKFTCYLSDADPGTNFIYDLTDDGKGSLWLTTDYGLIKFTPDTGVIGTKATGSYRQILPFNDIFPYRIYRNRVGEIFVGGAFQSGKGYYRFHPDSIPDNRNIPPIVLTDFRVNNKPYILDTSITYKKHISLNYNQNFFSIECAALDYNDPIDNQYAHYLEGLEDDWVHTGNFRLANYTDVPPGHYIFHAKGSNADDYWNDQGASLSITILPPPWKTWWAYGLYGVFIIVIAYLIIRFFLKRLQLSHSLELEQVEKEKLIELDSMKSRFFANISHEFRTPLTLILGPLEKLRSKVSDNEGAKDLNIMQRNALRLQNLINQLLNLSKLESGQMKLHAMELDFIKLVNGYVMSFESLANQRKINLIFKAEVIDMRVFVDQEKLEKILYNLLSNAFKFTVEKGQIMVEVTNHQSMVNIIVSDTGPGIPPEKLPHIFDRFYQANDTFSREQEGTGIGLALAKELVELHHGNITVESKVNKGTNFTVNLPLGRDHLMEEEIIDQDEISKFENSISNVENLEISYDTIDTNIEQQTINQGQPVILIVEDNSELREYICDSLGQHYQILEAQDGVLGLKLGIETLPDLIISDVMMPKMDGFELCKKLKTDERTSHIPMILLTARAGMESKLEGLETGADDYITKPFDGRELLVRINNLLELRLKLREHFIKDAEQIGLSAIIDLPEADISSMDQKFLQKVIGIVNTNLSDPEFTVKIFCAEMAMSNMQLHRKLVAVTGQTANRFIRSNRLNYAAKLLEKRAGNVTEIAYEVGFNNLSWFAKCFQEQFGMSPSEYLTKKTEL